MSHLLVTKRLFSTIVGKVALLQTFVEQHEFVDTMFWKKDGTDIPAKCKGGVEKNCPKNDC